MSVAFSTPGRGGRGVGEKGRYDQGRGGGAFQIVAAARVVPRVHNAVTGAELRMLVKELVLFNDPM